MSDSSRIIALKSQLIGLKALIKVGADGQVEGPPIFLDAGPRMRQRWYLDDHDSMNADQGAAESARLAIHYWEAFPFYYRMGKDDNTPEGCASPRHLDEQRACSWLTTTHRLAVQILFRAAEREGIDATYILEEGTLCRDLFRYRKEVFAGLEDGPWPGCLGQVRTRLRAHEREVILKGEAVYERLKVKLDRGGPAPLPAPPEEDLVIWWLDNFTYRVGEGKALLVTKSQDAVLASFLGRPVMSEKQLVRLSGNENARKTLHALKAKASFADAIRLPERKGEGYGADVRRADSKR